MVDVVDGGLESLKWSALVINVSTGQIVCDWKEFKHGTNTLYLSLDRNKLHLGDQLQLQLHANSGSGRVTLIGG